MVQSEQRTVQVPKGQVFQRIARATGALMLIQVILRGFGLIEKMILSLVFGMDYRTDAYFAAQKVAFALFTFFDQIIMHSFLPVFVKRLEERGEQDAWRLASSVVNILIPLVLLIVFFGNVHTEAVISVLLPDWLSETKQQILGLAIQLTRVMLVAMVFLVATSLTYCLLNSYKKFALPAAADLALKGTVLLCAVLFAGAWGPYALAVGFIFGGAAKLFVHGGGLGRRVAHYRPVIAVSDPGLKQFALLALPLAVGGAFSLVRQAMDLRFTSVLPQGSLSALDFAKKLTDLPVQFFPFVFGIALFPFLADIAMQGDRERLRQMLMTATRMMVLLFLPLAIGLIALRIPIITGIYGSDKFGAEAVALTAVPLPMYAAGMLFGALEIIVLQFYFAMSDTIRPAIVGILMVPLHIAVGYLGIFYLQWGIIAIALALFVSKGTKVAVLYTMIRKKVGSLELRKSLPEFGKILLALAPFTLLLLAAAYVLPGLLPAAGAKAGKVMKLLLMVPYLCVGMVGAGVYFYLLHRMKVSEVSMLVDRVRGKLKKASA